MSQTACTHCGSTNSIKTAGKSYCADCGQLITAKKEIKKEEPKPKAHAQKAPASKPRKPAAPPLNLKVIEESRSPKAKAKAAPGVLDLTGSKPKPARKPIGTHKPATKSKPKAAVKKQPEVLNPSFLDEVEPVIADSVVQEVPQAIKNQEHEAQFSSKKALHAARKQAFKGRVFITTLIAVAGAAVCMAVFWSIFGETLSYAISESVKAGAVNVARATTILGHIAWATLVGLGGYLLYVYMLALLVLRGSHKLDKQHHDVGAAHKAALGSLVGIAIIDLISYLLIITSGTLAVGANIGFLGTKSLGVYGIVLATLTNATIIYLWLGLISARIMAGYALVLGQTTVRRAYGVGWSLYNHQFGRVTFGMVVILFVGLIWSVPAVIATKLLGGGSIVTMGIVAVIGIVTKAIVLGIAVNYFLRLYRAIIAKQYDPHEEELLLGRQPHTVHLGRRLIALGLIAVLVIVKCLVVIANASAIASALIR